jgi:hypothetical protein
MKDCANHWDLVQSHLEVLAAHLREAYQVVSENNRNGRERQKEYYNQGTKLVTFHSRDMVYLRERVNSKQRCPKFRIRGKAYARGFATCPM